MNQQSLGIVLASGNVQRCHTIPTVKPQTVGAHTWRTLVILHWLYAPEYPPPHLTHGLLMHDVPELRTGDMPGDIKHADRVLAAAMDRQEDAFLSEHGIEYEVTIADERRLVSLCDRADLAMYALDEVEMGNRNMLHVARKAFDMTVEIEQSIDGREFTQELNRRIQVLVQGVNHRLTGLELTEGTWPNW